MKLTSEVLQHYVGGQLEVQNKDEGYLYRGEVAEAAIQGENVVVKLVWNAKGEGYPPLPNKWVVENNLSYSVSLVIATPSDIGQGKLALYSQITGEMAIFYPNYGSKLDPATVEGLVFPGDLLKPKAKKWKLEGYDTLESEYYPLEGEYDTREEAEIAAIKRLKYLEELQPSESSGGQTEEGIQDRVYLVSPNGERIRFTE